MNWGVRLLAAFVGSVLLGQTSPVSAAKKSQAPGTLVLRLEHPGLPAPVVAALEEAVRGEMEARQPGSLLPPPALDMASMRVAAGCADEGAACLAGIGRMLGAAEVLQVSLQGSSKSTTIQFLLVPVRGQKAKSGKAELERVDEASGEELRFHLKKFLGLNPPPLTGRIVLRSPGTGPSMDSARFFLDDKPVDRTSLSSVEPGSHRLAVHLDGFETFLWMGAVRPGRDTPVPVRLERARPSEETPPIAAASDGPSVEATTAVQPQEDEAPGLLLTYVLGGGAIASAAVGTIFGLRVADLQKRSDAKEPCRPGQDDDYCAEGEQAQTINIVAWSFAGGLAVATVVALLIETGSFSSGEALPRDEPVSVFLVPGKDGVLGQISIPF